MFNQKFVFYQNFNFWPKFQFFDRTLKLIFSWFCAFGRIWRLMDYSANVLRIEQFNFWKQKRKMEG
mgnify:CR=1 FL=1